MTTAAEWKTKQKNWSNLDILAEAARIVYEQEENKKRFFSVFPRKSRSWVRIARRYPQNPSQNLNGASTSTSSSSLFDLNLIPSDFNHLQSQLRSPSSPSSDFKMENPQNPNSHHFFIGSPSSRSLPGVAANSETENPNSQSTPCKRRAVEQRKASGGIKKAKVVPFSWVGKVTPEWLVQVMGYMNVDGGDAKLIFEKVLSSTDVNPSQSRLLLPFNQLHRNDFLTPEESSYIRSHGGDGDDEKKPGVEAVVVNQSYIKWTVYLKIWEMKKDSSGKGGSLNYALNYGWNKIVKANGLKEGHVISLWSFRCQEVLYFALVRPPTTITA